MTDEEQVYRLPASTNNDVRRMMVGLSWFFGIALILAILFVIYAPTILKLVPFSVEKNFVKPYEEIAERWWDGEASPEVDAYLQQLVDDLSIAIELPEEMKLQAHYIDSEEVNAFAMLGGHVFITRGLLEFVEDENSLSMVIAHEVAHQKHRDPITSMSRGIAIQMIYSLITSDYYQVDLSELGGQLGLLYFSRDQEEQADKAAIHALQKHYGHIGGYDQFFRGILETEKAQGDDMPEWLSSHPNTSLRIDSLKELEAVNGWRKNQTRPIPEEILALLYEAPI